MTVAVDPFSRYPSVVDDFRGAWSDDPGYEPLVAFPAAVPYPGDGITTRDVLAYYESVADLMLPHLRRRPLTVRMFPDGIIGQGPFRREVLDQVPVWLPVAKVPLSDDRGFIRQVICDDKATLLYLASRGAVEFHVTLSTIESIRFPNRLVIDLDPPEHGDVANLRRAARHVRDLFIAIGLKPFVQTTGGRGVHVVAPLDGHSSYHLVTPLAGDIAAHVAATAPTLLTVDCRGVRRGRIFVGANRNAYGQTMIAPYSLRGRPGAPTATPLDWSEVGRVEPGQHRLRNLRRRLGRKPDPWANIDAYAEPAATVREVRVGLN
jgi:bifunctional non-homologous end joining protein LigD